MSGNHHNSEPKPVPVPGGRMQQAKLVLLGDQGVGKSSLALRFVRGQFPEYSESTVGAAFLTQTLQVQGQNVKFDIWDTAGQERYHSLAPMYYRGAQAAIVVYDINNANTFEHAVLWVRELRQQGTSNIVIVLAGNKFDLASEHRAVEIEVLLSGLGSLEEDARAFAEETGLIFAECSAKNGYAVNEMFSTIANKMAARQQPRIQEHSQAVRLTSEIDQESDSSGCQC